MRQCAVYSNSATVQYFSGKTTVFVIQSSLRIIECAARFHMPFVCVYMCAEVLADNERVCGGYLFSV